MMAKILLARCGLAQAYCLLPGTATAVGGKKRTNSLMHLRRGRDAQDIAVVGSTPPQQNVGCLLDGVSHRIQPRSKNGS